MLQNLKQIRITSTRMKNDTSLFDEEPTDPSDFEPTVEPVQPVKRDTPHRLAKKQVASRESFLKFLPPELRAAAEKLPAGKEHTVLELPPEGEGHNAGLIKVAAICYKMGVSFDDTLTHLQDIYSHDRLDHNTAPRRAVSRVWNGGGDLAMDDTETAGMPDIQEELLLRFRRSPSNGVLEVSPSETNFKPAHIIPYLFAQGDIINIQRGQFEAGTLLEVSNIGQFQAELFQYKFLNPSTFKSVGGVANPLDDGKVSTRCNANVKSRPYMLLEMDSKDEAQVERFNSFAIELSKFIPLTLAVETGNKSVHFWFNSRHATPKQIETIFTLACLHGADKRMAVRSQIARMPNVSSADNGRGAQRVIYFDTSKGHDLKKEDGKWDVGGFE